MIRLAPQRRSRCLFGAARPKIRIGRLNARAGETEEFLAALVSANRAIDDRLAQGRHILRLGFAEGPRRLGGDSGIRAWRQRTGKDLKDISVIDKARAQETRCRDRLPARVGEFDCKTWRAGPARVVDAGKPRQLERAATSRWRPRPARSRHAPPSSPCRAMCWPRAISNHPDIPKRQLDAAAKLSLGSYDHIVLQLPGNSVGARPRRHLHRAKRLDPDGAFICKHRVFVAVLDRCRGLVRPRSHKPRRARMVAFAVEWLTKLFGSDAAFRREEVERDPLEFLAIRAGRDVIGGAGRTAIAQNSHGAARLYVSRRGSDPRNAVGKRWTVHGRAASARRMRLCEKSAR